MICQLSYDELVDQIPNTGIPILGRINITLKKGFKTILNTKTFMLFETISVKVLEM
jgi:hypothetical protein